MTTDELDRVLDLVDEAILDSTGSALLSARVRRLVSQAAAGDLLADDHDPLSTPPAQLAPTR